MSPHNLIWYLLRLSVGAAFFDACAHARSVSVGGKNPRIAVIGGGLSGTFVSKYLVDYDKDCSISELIIFDPQPKLGQVLQQQDVEGQQQQQQQQQPVQPSRIASLQLKNGHIVELGASIAYSGFTYVVEMIKSGKLTMGEPMATGVTLPEGTSQYVKAEGVGIFNGKADGFAIVLGTAAMKSAASRAAKESVLGNYSLSAMLEPYWDDLGLLWRYNIDLIRLSKATEKAEVAFQKLHELINDDERFFFDSPDDMWNAVHLLPLVHSSLEKVCDALGIASKEKLQWWRKYFMSGQGILRDELLAALTINNYNQDLPRINGWSGLGSFVAMKAGDQLFSVVGGNIKLVESAFEQAKQNRRKNCPKDALEGQEAVTHVQARLSTVVGSLEGFDVYGESGKLFGQFDLVILAAPLAMANIDFLIKSHMDEAVLQPMPLGGLVKNDEEGNAPIADGHEGHEALPRALPPSATRPYTQVVTTMVSHARLQPSYFGLLKDEELPEMIIMTAAGKRTEHNITTISQITPVFDLSNPSSGSLYKVFSDEPVSVEVLNKYLGPDIKIEHQMIWGGKRGGATPDYQGDGVSTDFLLYDGATGFHGHTKSGALYYPSSMELSFACMELSAMGAKAVAKLVAKRMEWIGSDSSTKTTHDGEEL